MRFIALAVIVAAAAVIALAGVGTAQAPQTTAPADDKKSFRAASYWQQRGCERGYRSQGARNRIRTILHSHRASASINRKLVRHLAVCVATRKKALAGRRVEKKGWSWRKEYAHYWWIKFHGLPSYEQAWAWNTGACESGNDPNKNTGNGFYGAHQWMISTWQDALATLGIPGPASPLDTSYPHQAYVAVKWKWYTSDEQWPVCGD